MIYVLFSALWFSDGGPPEVSLLTEGTLKDCQRVATFINAVAYSGNRPIRESALVTWAIFPGCNVPLSV